MRDVALVAPIIVTGGTILVAILDSHRGPSSTFVPQLVFLGFLLGLLFAWHRGKQAAAERLRALELGWGPTETVGRRAPAQRAITIGVATPIVLLCLAAIAGTVEPDLSPGVWITALLLGMTTLICGTVLLLFRPASFQPRSEPASHRATYKPMSDPDEFDVVGQRGSNGHHPLEERL